MYVSAQAVTNFAIGTTCHEQQYSDNSISDMRASTPPSLSGSSGSGTADSFSSQGGLQFSQSQLRWQGCITAAPVASIATSHSSNWACNDVDTAQKTELTLSSSSSATAMQHQQCSQAQFALHSTPAMPKRVAAQAHCGGAYSCGGTCSEFAPHCGWAYTACSTAADSQDIQQFVSQAALTMSEVRMVCLSTTCSRIFYSE